MYHTSLFMIKCMAILSVMVKSIYYALDPIRTTVSMNICVILHLIEVLRRHI